MAIISRTLRLALIPPAFQCSACCLVQDIANAPAHEDLPSYAFLPLSPDEMKYNGALTRCRLTCHPITAAAHVLSARRVRRAASLSKRAMDAGGLFVEFQTRSRRTARCPKATLPRSPDDSCRLQKGAELLLFPPTHPLALSFPVLVTSHNFIFCRFRIMLCSSLSLAALVSMVSAHGVMTGIQGANGVNVRSALALHPSES
jgi:hypothetical protein